ncbi:uncharacterized protein ARMOST_17122 [Armillaria ostoyae]|uniref:Uncharacterized protein n=1 Tax=Armillaria ostoyae TaxID=47428 RepID=A0A284RY39_ARMOS|nr:uncharacterized protein ARMOST_17122 [Armillaria ostoyae]
MPPSLGITAPSRSLMLPPYNQAYSLATTTRTSLPPFSISGNPTVRSSITWDHANAVKWTSTPPRSSPSSHWRPVPSDPPKTVRLDVEGCHAAVDDTRNARRRRPHPPCPVYGQLIFFVSKILSMDPLYTTLFAE